MLFYLLFITQIVLDALSDALNSKIKMNTGNNSSLAKGTHIAQALQVLLWLILLALIFTGYIKPNEITDNSLVIDKLLWFSRLLLGYTILRFAIFDYCFNLFAGNIRSYFGKSSYYDLIINSIIIFFQKIAPKMPMSFISWIIFVIRFVLFFESYKIITKLIQ